jgi:hypothetical protein
LVEAVLVLVAEVVVDKSDTTLGSLLLLGIILYLLVMVEAAQMETHPNLPL